MSQLPRFTEEEIAQEVEILRKQHDNARRRIQKKVARIFIRTTRIVCGLALFVAFCFCVNSAYEQLSQPFAAQSLLGIASGLFMSYLSWVLIVWSYSAAFGKGPTLEDEEQTWRNRALHSLTIKRPVGISLVTSDPMESFK